jgi:hypothetical protein
VSSVPFNTVAFSGTAFCIFSPFLDLLSGETKRGGPGRKSNAEHALNFYEYVLSLNEKASEDKGAEMESDLDDSEERPDDEDQEDEKSVVTMETQEFLDQHNDLCEGESFLKTVGSVVASSHHVMGSHNSAQSVTRVVIFYAVVPVIWSFT